MSWSWSWVISSQNYIKIIPLVMFLTTNFSNHLKKLFHNWCMQEKNNPTLHFLGCFWDVKIRHIIFLIYFFLKNTTKHDGNIFCECFLWVDIQRTSIRGQALNIMSRWWSGVVEVGIKNCVKKASTHERDSWIDMGFKSTC